MAEESGVKVYICLEGEKSEGERVEAVYADFDLAVSDWLEKRHAETHAKAVKRQHDGWTMPGGGFDYPSEIRFGGEAEAEFDAGVNYWRVVEFDVT
jgi:hypothetical protein